MRLHFARPTAWGSTTAVVRGRFEDDRLTGVEDVFRAQSRGGGHYGGRLAWDRDGYLFAFGRRLDGEDAGRSGGAPRAGPVAPPRVTVRLPDDGGVPDDNPFVGRPGARPGMWSCAHRNPHGLLVHPETGDRWAHEHGPQGGDELNLIRPALNYG